MFSIPTRKTMELLSEREFVIRGVLEQTENYSLDYVDVVIESLGADPNLLRDGARQFLKMHCYTCIHNDDQVKLDFEDRIVPNTAGDAPQAFRVQIRLPLVSRSKKSRKCKHPIRVLRVQSVYLAESIQNVLDEMHSTLSAPNHKLRSWRTTL